MANITHKKNQRTFYGYIYALSNPDLDTLKIGYTTNPVDYRCRQWSEMSNLTKPFNVAFKEYFHRPWIIEKRLHKVLSNHNESGEYFKITADELQLIVKYNFKPSNRLKRMKRAIEKARPFNREMHRKLMAA